MQSGLSMPVKKVKPPKPEPFDIVIVTWEDAFGLPSAQFSSPIEALGCHKPMIRRCLGYFVAQNDKITILCTDDDRDDRSPEAVGGMNFIPTDMVRGPIKIVKRAPKSAK